MNIAINGFGRIGRQVLRIIHERKLDVNIVAINDLAPTATMAYLLKYDSVHGRFPGEVTSDDTHIFVDGKSFQVLSEKDPAKLPWASLGVDVVVESTGVFRSREKLQAHLTAGAKKVILSAPAEDDLDLTVVLGVNESSLDDQCTLVSNASCTTNAAAAMLKVMHDAFKINRVMLTTIHAYTNDQSLHDQPHRDLRRARAAAVSLIPTTTGSATDVAKVIPELKGKMTGISVRAPQICGSLNDVVIELSRDVTKEEVNEVFKAAAAGAWKGLVEYTEDPIVSVDIIGNPASVIIDGLSTTVLGGNMVKVLGWYDNEMGYSHRVVDLIAKLKN